MDKYGFVIVEVPNHLALDHETIMANFRTDVVYTSYNPSFFQHERSTIKGTLKHPESIDYLIKKMKESGRIVDDYSIKFVHLLP